MLYTNIESALKYCLKHKLCFNLRKKEYWFRVLNKDSCYSLIVNIRPTKFIIDVEYGVGAGGYINYIVIFVSKTSSLDDVLEKTYNVLNNNLVIKICKIYNNSNFIEWGCNIPIKTRMRVLKMLFGITRRYKRHKIKTKLSLLDVNKKQINDLSRL